MQYRFKSDKESKIRFLKVEGPITASDFCILLSEETFKGRKPTCTFIPVNMDGNDIVNELLVVDQSYGQKFKSTPELGEIVEDAIPSWISQYPPPALDSTRIADPHARRIVDPHSRPTRTRRWHSPPARTRRWQSPTRNTRRRNLSSRDRKRRRRKKRRWERM